MTSYLLRMIFFMNRNLALQHQWRKCVQHKGNLGEKWTSVGHIPWEYLDQPPSTNPHMFIMTSYWYPEMFWGLFSSFIIRDWCWKTWYISQNWKALCEPIEVGYQVFCRDILTQVPQARVDHFSVCIQAVIIHKLVLIIKSHLMTFFINFVMF